MNVMNRKLTPYCHDICCLSERKTTWSNRPHCDGLKQSLQKRSSSETQFRRLIELHCHSELESKPLNFFTIQRTDQIKEARSLPHFCYRSAKRLTFCFVISLSSCFKEVCFAYAIPRWGLTLIMDKNKARSWPLFKVPAAE